MHNRLSGALLYPVSLVVMIRVMVLGGALLLGTTLWIWQRRRAHLLRASVQPARASYRAL